MSMIKGKGTRIKEKKRDYSKSICKGLSEYFLAIFLTQVGIGCREKHALPLEWRVPKITSKTLFKYNRKYMVSFIKDQIFNPPSLRLLTFSRSLVRPGVPTPRERAFCSVTEETPP
jgi:hypothetical protein